MSAIETTEQVLWKYPLELISGPQTITVPAISRVAHVAWFHARPTLWLLVDKSTPTTTRTFQVAATGQLMPPFTGAIYHGTVIQADTYVWHIFELLTDDQTA